MLFRSTHEEVVPVRPFITAINQISGDHQEAGIGVSFMGLVQQGSPLFKAALRVAHGEEAVVSAWLWSARSRGATAARRAASRVTAAGAALRSTCRSLPRRSRRALETGNAYLLQTIGLRENPRLSRPHLRGDCKRKKKRLTFPFCACYFGINIPFSFVLLWSSQPREGVSTKPGGAPRG